MQDDQAIKLFKCLADKSRLQILKSLMQEDMGMKWKTVRKQHLSECWVHFPRY